MDFQSLSRKDLQTLCKKNKIPANITSVAMAEALAALQEVAGIEKFLSPIESESNQSEERINNESPGNCRAACRTSTRRKPVKEEPPITQSIIRTRRGRVGEVADQENKDLNILSTPLLPSNRRRAPVPSARKKLEAQSVRGKEEEKNQNNVDQKRSDVLAIPSMPKTQRKVSGLEDENEEDNTITCNKEKAISTESPLLQEKADLDITVQSEENSDIITEETVEFNDEDLVVINVEEVEFQYVQDSMSDGKISFKEMVDSMLDIWELSLKDQKRSDVLAIPSMPKTQRKVSGLEDENEEDNTITCNKGENFSKEKAISTESPLLQEKADSDITVQSEENSDIITEETVEFNDEDLVVINVEEVEFQYVQDSMSDGKISFKEMVDSMLDIWELSLKDQKRSDVLAIPSMPKTQRKVSGLEDENEEDNTITCNKGENFSKEKAISTESPLLQEKADSDITVQSEENSDIITEETVEFNDEDLVVINVEEVEFQYVQDSMSFKEMVDSMLDIWELSMNIHK